MIYKYIIFFLFLSASAYCTSDPQTEKNREANRKQTLLSLIVNKGVTADCVYCSNTQAFQGSCSCYTNIPVLTCQGLPSGNGKSNSYKISCADLVSGGGIWTQDGAGNSSCNYLTCPPEAYRAAFTAEGR
ncbi:hypothetical protein EHO60_08875 [Leptospira fletcheri]|uniref:Lipoprotein n=1 Tax=Leptospira fletcheri TaxID=2484981 RepID=A0A4R9GHW5_9LEPT|nr:hypothetical protein [Leptospira fletcheri]TGK12354.1 hypothetical protein EHO60_08875 [Leptospira fletcheri]